VGLPGRIWTSKQPAWIPDVSSQSADVFLRVEIALQMGLKAGFGVPIVTADEVQAVLTFFLSEFHGKHTRLVELVSAVAAQLGPVIQRKRAEEALRESEKELIQRKLSLEKVNRELIETNQALSVLARNIDRDKELLEKKIYETTIVNVMPIIEELKSDINCQKRLADLELLITYLKGLISKPTDHHDIIISLTEQEMRVAALIKNNLTSQKIANMLYISEHTVKTHRKNIRKKLKIQNSTVNLTSYLKQKM
jgi:DNA-binding CsgD family transcriptional regulator